jgi:hypothetical protein
MTPWLPYKFLPHQQGYPIRVCLLDGTEILCRTYCAGREFKVLQQPDNTEILESEMKGWRKRPADEAMNFDPLLDRAKLIIGSLSPGQLSELYHFGKERGWFK